MKIKNIIMGVHPKFRALIICLFLCFFIFGAAQNAIKYPASNATNVCADMQFKLTFATAPVLQSSGTIKLYKSDGTLVETIDLSLIPTGVPTAATWPWSQTLSGTAVKVVKVIIEDKTAIISFANGSMNYGTSYYVTVDQNIFSNSAALGFAGIAARQWSITTKATAPTADLDYVVAADGNGDFATLQGALDFIPTNNTSKAKIYVRNGIYVGLISSKSKNNITIEGESVDGVILKGYNNATMNSTRYFAQFTGNDLNFINLTFINTTPNGGSQAESLYLSGDRNVIVNCNFFSYQDTVCISGKIYLKDCLIEGNTDFIWGNGAVFFQSCEIRSTLKAGYNVQARNGSGARGYAFADCNITSTSSAANGSVLGRDAGTATATNVYAEIVYLNCKIGSHISTLGWNTSRLTTAQASTIFFAEYKSVKPDGTLIDLSGRDPNSKQMSDAQNTKYRDLSWFFGGWIPTVPAYSLSKKPTVTITSPSNGTISVNINSVILTATASDADGTVAKVDFYDGATILDSIKSAPYTYVWNTPSLGTHIITAVATDNSGLTTTSSTVSVSVTVPVTGVLMSSEATTVNKNETVQLTAAVQPTVGTNQNVTWISRNNAIASVNSLGEVTGVSSGNTIIVVATEDGNKTDSCLVTVTDIFRPVTAISVLPVSATVNKIETKQLIATILPTSATNKSVSWTTSNSAVATVSSTGLVRAVGVGSTIITVTAEDGGLSASCNIDVVDPPLPTPLIKLGFNENSGSTVSNSGSSSATFTKTAMPAWSTNVPVGGGASSVDFGTTTGDNYVESSSTISQLAGLPAFTITGWVNCVSSTVGAGGNRIISWINNGGNGVDVVCMADGSLKVGINQWPDNTVAISSTGKITASSTTPSSNWKFFAITYNSTTSTLQFYFGDNAASATLDKSLTYTQGAVGTTIGKLCIGHFNTESQRTTRTDRMFRGLIDQIEVYNSVLTLNNIQTVQNISGLNSSLFSIFSDNNENNSIKLYPNPVIDKIIASGNSNSSVTALVKIYNSLGCLMKCKNMGTIERGDFNLNIPVDNIPSGVYFVQIQLGVELLTGQFIKK